MARGILYMIFMFWNKKERCVAKKYFPESPPCCLQIFEKYRKDTWFLNPLQRLILIVFLVVILKNSESELSQTLWNMWQEEPCFPDCWKAFSVIPMFWNKKERSAVTNYSPVYILSSVGHIFEKENKWLAINYF